MLSMAEESPAPPAAASIPLATAPPPRAAPVAAVLAALPAATAVAADRAALPAATVAAVPPVLVAATVAAVPPVLDATAPPPRAAPVAAVLTAVPAATTPPTAAVVCTDVSPPPSLSSAGTVLLSSGSLLGARPDLKGSFGGTLRAAGATWPPAKCRGRSTKDGLPQAHGKTLRNPCAGNRPSTTSASRSPTLTILGGPLNNVMLCSPRVEVPRFTPQRRGRARGKGLGFEPPVLGGWEASGSCSWLTWD